MFYQFIYPLYNRYFIFNVFRYITFRSVYATVTAILVCFVFGPPIMKKLRLIGTGSLKREWTPETHEKKVGTPSMGGLLIILSILSSILLWGNFSNRYTILITVSTFCFGLIGFFDDYLKFVKKSSRGLHARFKLYTQVLISSAVVFYLYFGPSRTAETTLLYVPFINEPVADLSFFYIPFAILLIVGTSNAVNLTDGLDGLATGLVIFVVGAYAGLSYLTGHVKIADYLRIPYIPGSAELTVFCMSILGAGIGFLWFNAYPAQVFMGDTGALAIGGCMAVLSVVLKQEALFLILGGLFVAEALSSQIQDKIGIRWLGRRIFYRAPLHHHMQHKGLAETKVVIRLWIAAGILALTALATIKLR